MSKFITPVAINGRRLGMQRLLLSLLGVLSGLGLTLCVLGIYGLVANCSRSVGEGAVTLRND